MRLAKALIRLRVCAGWFEALLVVHTTLLEISCRGSYALCLWRSAVVRSVIHRCLFLPFPFRHSFDINKTILYDKHMLRLIYILNYRRNIAFRNVIFCSVVFYLRVAGLCVVTSKWHIIMFCAQQNTHHHFCVQQMTHHHVLCSTKYTSPFLCSANDTASCFVLCKIHITIFVSSKWHIIMFCAQQNTHFCIQPMTRHNVCVQQMTITHHHVLGPTNGTPPCFVPRQ